MAVISFVRAVSDGHASCASSVENRSKSPNARKLAFPSSRTIEGMQRRASTVSAIGTITIPKSIRDVLGLSSGGRIEWLLGVDGQAVIRVKHRYVKGGIVQAETSGISPVDSDSLRGSRYRETRSRGWKLPPGYGLRAVAPHRQTMKRTGW
jgi:AbrB family looped-hinge helix DNA binding protein